ncbi:MAG: VCBS repeat-containing protein [Deltaproteobacteria bacterium]|nr:VCBS repeat-containing protein [Deltaproteobacteria bacterium]
MRRATFFAFAVLLPACIETDVNPKDDATGGPLIDTAPPDCPPHIPDCEDTEEPIDTQVIDTEVPDPEDCAVELAPAGSVSVAEVCEGAAPTPVTDPWQVKIEWTGSRDNTYHMGLIANLTDDDGDGDVDETDTPDVVYISTNGRLVVLDGATGAEHWSAMGYQAYAVGAVADVDSDGVTDILTVTQVGEIVALDASGARMWTSTVPSTGLFDILTVADLDGDGDPEVLSNEYVLNGQDGSLIWSPPANLSIPYHGPIAGDFDLDGDQEVIIQDTVYDSDGTLLWSASIKGIIGHWSAVLNYDDDDEAEIVMIAGGKYTLYEHDGVEIFKVSAGTEQPGAPCVGDFDGDGEAEIAWASTFSFNAYELNGSEIWSASIDDTSGLAGCSAYDLDGDGRLEILFTDHRAFYIFDGATGAVRFTNTDHRSDTIFEYPTVADVDNDGSAEIVIASSESGAALDGITVFGHDGDGWPKSGTTWHAHDFAVTNINPDGSVPKNPEPSWIKHNVFRARPAVDDLATADLSIHFTEHCVASCEGDGLVRIALQAQNIGAKPSKSPTPWALYSIDETVSLITTGTLPEIAAGEKPEGWEVVITATQFGRGGLMVVIDDDGTGLGKNEECVEDNNIDYLYDVPCGW